MGEVLHMVMNIAEITELASEFVNILLIPFVERWAPNINPSIKMRLHGVEGVNSFLRFVQGDEKALQR